MTDYRIVNHPRHRWSEEGRILRGHVAERMRDPHSGLALIDTKAQRDDSPTWLSLAGCVLVIAGLMVLYFVAP